MVLDTLDPALREIPVDQIDRNPENPRIVFRSTELEALQESIRRHGVRVPISVYKEGRRYVLIDGERRWRCCIKLNRKTIPAVVQEQVDPLTNMLLMFNIHALREQWDLLTIALKLPRVIGLLEADLGRPPTERDLSEQTGLPRGVIRRCRLLIQLPEKYRADLLRELNKPKHQQRLSEDLLIEMERALKTVERAIPGIIDDKDRVRDILLDKYKKNVIRSVTEFRDVSKIARADRVRADASKARAALKRVFEANEYSPRRAYEESVLEAYSERDVLTRISGLLERLNMLLPDQIDDELRDSLKQLVLRISALLRRAQ